VHRRPIILGWLLLAITPWSTFAYQTPQFDISVVTPVPVFILPGQIVTLSFSTSNRTGQDRDVVPMILLPEGWRSFTRHQPISAKPFESNSWISTLRVPANAQAGIYRITIRLTDPAQTTTLAETIVPVTIERVLSMGLQHLTSPRFVSAGSRYISEFLLSNNGNTEIDVRMRPSGMSGFPTTVTPAVLRLKPQESQTVRLEVTTPDTLRSSIRYIVELLAINSADTTNKASNASMVDVIPAVGANVILYHRLPMNLTVRGVAQKDRYGGQLEFLGEGSLSDRLTDQLAFRFRGPNTQRTSVLGQYDEYRLAYSRSGLNVRLGDHPFLLTPLTEYGRYAFGAGADVDFSRFTFGGFSNRTRWTDPAQDERAGFLRYNFSTESSIGLHYLGKREDKNAELGSVRGLFQPLPRTILDVEYGQSERESHRDEGYSVRLRTQQPWMNFDLWYFRVGPHYGGYYRDIDHKSASVNIYPLSLIRLEASYREEYRNLLKDTVQFSAPRDRFMQFGIAYGSYGALFYRQSAQKDLLPLTRADSREDLIQLRLGHYFDGVSATAFAETGQLHDQLLRRRYPFHRLFSSLNLRPFNGHSYTLAGDYFKGRNLYTDELQERLSFNFSAWILLGRSTFIGSTVNVNRITGEFRHRSIHADLSLEQYIFSGHRLAARGRISRFSPRVIEGESAVMLEYSIPIGFPIARVGTTGQIRGRITRAESNTGLRNALVFVGPASSLTDADGQYNFPSLLPGEYYLTLDRSSIGLDHVTTVPVPVKIDVAGGSEKRLDLSVVKSATIEGTILRYAGPETYDTTRTEQRLVGGHVGAVLELRSDAEEFRRVSDNRGRFLFTDLRPGSYELIVAEGNLPEFTVFEKDRFDLTLSPNENLKLQLKVIPRRRTLRIVESGELVQRPGRVVARATQPERRPTQPVIVETSPTIQPAPVQAPPPDRPAGPPSPAVADPTVCRIFPNSDHTGFTLQLSSWRSQTQAQKLAREAERISGYRSYVERAVIPGRGTWYRVQLINFTSEETAAEVCIRLTGASAPEPTATPVPTPVTAPVSAAVDSSQCQISPSADGVGYTVRLSMWRSRERAEEAAAEAQRLSLYPARVEESTDPVRGRRYMVQLIHVRTRSIAEQICAKLRGTPPSRAPLPSATPSKEIQVSSWKTREKADQVASRIHEAFGYTVKIEEVYIPGLGKRYRVFLAGFASESEAQSASRRVQELFR